MTARKLRRLLALSVLALVGCDDPTRPETPLGAWDAVPTETGGVVLWGGWIEIQEDALRWNILLYGDVTHTDGGPYSGSGATLRLTSDTKPTDLTVTVHGDRMTMTGDASLYEHSCECWIPRPVRVEWRRRGPQLFTGSTP